VGRHRRRGDRRAAQTPAPQCGREDLASIMTPGSSGMIAPAGSRRVPDVEKKHPTATAVRSAPVSDEAAAQGSGASSQG